MTAQNEDLQPKSFKWTKETCDLLAEMSKREFRSETAQVSFLIKKHADENAILMQEESKQ